MSHVQVRFGSALEPHRKASRGGAEWNTVDTSMLSSRGDYRFSCCPLAKGALFRF